MPKAPLLFLSMAAALAFSAASLAAVKAIDPERRLDVTVTIFDKRMEVMLLRQAECKGGGGCYMTEWVDITVGDLARFTIVNKGTKPHDFKIFGKVRTTAIKPGHKTTFIMSLNKRGQFPYLSTLNGNKGLRGTFSVN
jgi:plastocyanin